MALNCPAFIGCMRGCMAFHVDKLKDLVEALKLKKLLH